MKNFKIIGVILICVVFSSFYLMNKNAMYLPKTQFKVIKVNGNILFVKTETPMKRGDVFTLGTPLKFETNTSRAAVINPEKGRFIIQPNHKGKVKILPATSNITSRSGALINTIDLQNHFSGNYLIFDTEEIVIGKEAYPMDDQHFFYLKYTYNNEEIAKKLPYTNDNTLIIDKKDIYKIDGKPIPYEPIEMTLYYRDNIDKKSYKINTFKPVFPDLVELKFEIELLLNEFPKDSSNEFKISEITSYLNEFYGKPQKQSLYNWLEKNYTLKIEQNIKFK
jgi:hypothetical protein